MKIHLTFKTPDVMENFSEENLSAFGPTNTLEEIDKAYEARNKAKTLVEKFVKYSECVTIEFDTEKDIAIVCEAH